MPIFDPKEFAAGIVAKKKAEATAGKPPAGGAFSRPKLEAPGDPGPGDPGEGAYEPEGEAGDGEQAAVAAMMAASEKKDSSGYAKGLKSFIEICYPQLARGKDEDE